MSSSKLRSLLAQLSFLILGLMLLWMALGRTNLDDFQRQFSQLDFFWIFVVLLISFLGHAIRALRWQLLLAPTDHHPSFWRTYQALMAGYFVNLAVPRLGEVSRCIGLKRTEKVPFNTSFGTVVTERAIDILCLLLIVVAVSLGFYEVVEELLQQYILPAVEQKLPKQRLWITLAGALMVIIGLGIVLKRPILNWLHKINVADYLKNFKQGLLSVFQLDQKGLFLSYTVLIWAGYFLTSFCCFFAYPATAHLGIKAGLALLAFGSIAKSLPIQGGGLGAYHFVAAQTLLLFALPPTDGQFLAVIIHGTTTLFQLIVGGICFGLQARGEKKRLEVRP